MADPRIAILYATVDGHTRKVASRMGKAISEAGFAPVMAEIDGLSDPLPPDVAGVVLAGPVRFGRHPARLRSYVERNRDVFRRLPSAFVSVSGAASGREPEHGEEARGYVYTFVTATSWRPDRVALVGGAVAYRTYNPVLRLVMKFISSRKGLSTDTRQKHEYTDWSGVDAFARGFAQRVADRRAAAVEAVGGRTAPSPSGPRPRRDRTPVLR